MRQAINALKKGDETRAVILAAATDLLLKDGPGKLVFREVAKRAHVAPGNVQYYFASKRDLLWAVLEPELQNYLERLKREIQQGSTTREKIRRIVGFLIRDVSSERTLCLWLSAWGMAAHDRQIAAMLSAWYQSYMDALAKLLREVFPHLDAEHAESAATAMTAQFDGLMIVLQIGRPKRRVVLGIMRNIESTISRIIGVDFASR